MNQFVIDQSARASPDQTSKKNELRRLVQEQRLHQALSEEHIAVLSAAERAQLIQDVTDDTLGYGPIDRFLHDPGITEAHGERPEDGLHRAARESSSRPTWSSWTRIT